MNVVFYNHKISQQRIQVAVPRKIAKRIGWLAEQIRLKEDKNKP